MLLNIAGGGTDGVGVAARCSGRDELRDGRAEGRNSRRLAEDEAGPVAKKGRQGGLGAGVGSIRAGGSWRCEYHIMLRAGW